MLCDFHAHTLLSDGVLSPTELVRRAVVSGYRAIGLTDHVAAGYLSRLINEIRSDCALVAASWQIDAFPGVELTHVPADAIAEVARKAKEQGAVLVVVHGETIAEPVEPGTNMAAVRCPHVDVLAHPGLLTLEEARLAAANGVFLELSARKGHCLTNGHVVKMARLASAKLIVNSDAHSEEDLLTTDLAQNIAAGAGLEPGEIKQVLDLNPRLLIDRLKQRMSARPV
ncbi:MAG: histidinol phosphate phosphatase domain-containing protein [Dehalococcoidia bacterium]|nr:histidinol phosphate phosphatase domain-containing protein [Dehalococcoidia bacterium]